MCTAISYNGLFGRNLDLEYSYGETVTITPRNYPFAFRRMGEMRTHYAMIGMAYVADGYPLYYEATNEKGLGMAGLNFVGNAVYFDEDAEKDNVSPFEFIPWVLGQCGSVDEARSLVRQANLVNIHFSDDLPLSELHWMISDGHRSFVVESRADGLHIHDNPIGVLTNNPPFEYQMWNLNNFMSLSPKQAENCFADRLELEKYSRGMGALGLPGDWSSASRFVRAAFAAGNSVGQSDAVGQFFHLLDAVAMPRGAVDMGGGRHEITLYSCCCGADGVYCYTTYSNRRITAVNLHGVDLDGCELTSYPLRTEQDFLHEN